MGRGRVLIIVAFVVVLLGVVIAFVVLPRTSYLNCSNGDTRGTRYGCAD